MIITVLFIIFFVLWLVALVPSVNARVGVYGGWLPWICVGLLALHVGMFSGIHN